MRIGIFQINYIETNVPREERANIDVNKRTNEPANERVIGSASELLFGKDRSITSKHCGEGGLTVNVNRDGPGYWNIVSNNIHLKTDKSAIHMTIERTNVVVNSDSAYISKFQ